MNLAPAPSPALVMPEQPDPAKTDYPKFSISILVLNNLELTKRCITSVMRSATMDYEIILTDNGSTEPVAEYFKGLQVRYDRVSHVIYNDLNHGFCAPNNHAFELSRGRYFVMLNNDAEVPREWLSKIAEQFERDSEVVLVGAAGACTQVGRGKEWLGKPGEKGMALDYLEGSCLAVKTSALRKANEPLFSSYMSVAYCEDVDLALRLRARGFKIAEADFKINHARASTSKQVPNIHRIHGDNHEKIQRRWGWYQEKRVFDTPFLVRRNAARGDVLLTTPIIHALKEQNPSADIYVETRNPSIFHGNPDIKWCGLIEALPPHIYRQATMIDLNMASENRPMTHIVDAYAEAALVDVKDKRPRFYLDRTSTEITPPDTMFECNRWVAVHPDQSTWVGRTWPADRWIKVIKHIESMGYSVVLLGKDTNRSDVTATLDMRGKTSLQQSAAILKHCDLFVGGDSLVVHLAQAMHVKTLGLFGCTLGELIMHPSGYWINADPSIPCAGIRHRLKGRIAIDCSTKCMESITVDQVTGKVEEIL